MTIKALSCKIAKGCYHVKKKGVPFNEEKLFALGVRNMGERAIAEL